MHSHYGFRPINRNNCAGRLADARPRHAKPDFRSSGEDARAVDAGRPRYHVDLGPHDLFLRPEYVPAQHLLPVQDGRVAACDPLPLHRASLGGLSGAGVRSRQNRRGPLAGLVGVGGGGRPVYRVLLGRIRMSLLSFCQWLQSIGFLSDIRESALVYPVIMTTHLSCIALFGGMILMTDMRLLGLALNKYTVTEVVSALRP